MSGVKHTPGTWKIDFSYPRGLPGGISTMNGGRPVTRFNTFARPTSPEALANARLIAAAPDLLEALQYAVNTIEAMRPTFSQVKDEGHAYHDQVLTTARAAIVKATAGEARNAEPIHRRDGDEG